MTTDSAWEPTRWVYIDPDATQFGGQVLGWEWRDDIEDVEEFVQYIRKDISDAAVEAARAEERERLLKAARELKPRDHYEIREAGGDYCAGVNDVVQALEAAIRKGDET